MFSPPPANCPLCPRLVAFREQNRLHYPDFHNAPVPSFGKLEAEFLVVGLAPGLKGANATGRPFTGDYAGIILYGALERFGFAKGHYQARPDDGFRLVNCRVTNAVRCVPPANKPETEEIKTCNLFLKDEIAAMPRLKLILSLGLVSHNAVLRAMGKKASFAKFTHGRVHPLTDTIKLLNSYHTSRYNMNTGTLTEAMFDHVIQTASKLLKHVS